MTLQKLSLSSASPARDADRPLVVDLDGTLFKADSGLESLLHCLTKTPSFLLSLLKALIRGRHHLKAVLATHSKMDLRKIPVSKEVMQFIENQKRTGRKLILATGANERLANEILRMYPIFDEGISSNSQVNLVGSSKGAYLEKRFGKRGFDYLGDAWADLNVWSRCSTAYYTNTDFLTRIALRLLHPHSVEIGKRSFQTSVTAFVKALRVHQWAKNSLIICPFMLAHRPLEVQSLALLLLGWLSFSLTASAAYLINDLSDIEHDRQHPVKCKRPIVAGDVSVSHALVLALLTGMAAAFIAWHLPAAFAFTVACYFVLAVAYSSYLKRVVVLDVIVLASFYTLRIVAGGVLADVELSHWFVVFSVFFFLSLALAKRCAEILNLKEEHSGLVKGRGYRPSDYQQLSQFGTTSGFMALLVYCLYIANPDVSSLYSKPSWLWFGFPILLFWICRVWLLTSKGLMHEDPVVFAFKDPHSYLAAILLITVIYVAI